MFLPDCIKVIIYETFWVDICCSLQSPRNRSNLLQLLKAILVGLVLEKKNLLNIIKIKRIVFCYKSDMSTGNHNPGPGSYTPRYPRKTSDVIVVNLYSLCSLLDLFLSYRVQALRPDTGRSFGTGKNKTVIPIAKLE